MAPLADYCLLGAMIRMVLCAKVQDRIGDNASQSRTDDYFSLVTQVVTLNVAQEVGACIACALRMLSAH